MRLRPGALLPALCLGAAVPLLWYAAWQRSRGNELDMYQSQFLELRQRLLYAEKENKKRSHELSSALDEIKHVVAKRMNLTNHTDDTKWKMLNLTRKLPMHLTNMYYYLPHLREYEDAIFPDIIFGRQRTGVSLVMGIPTVKREKQDYLINTLHSLLYELSEEQKNDCVIIIFVAEVNAQYVNRVAESVKTSFPTEIQSGVLEVISPPASYYPDLSNLKKTLGDSEDRVRWRTKQNLDYSFLMLYAQPKGTFYLQLEDDIIAKPGYIQSIKDFAAKQSQEWMILEFSQLGFIGKLFKSEDLPLIVDFFLMFYKDKPIDWLMDHLLWVKVCNPEKDAIHCEKEKAKLRIRAKPSLFQHVGIYSSLAGKIQNLKDKDFGQNVLHKAHNNPPAKVDTSLRIYQQYTLEKVYKGKDWFWASAPVAGDYISFTFLNPLKVEKYFFRSGNMEHPGDKLFNTTVEVLPADEMLRKELVDNGGKFNYPATKDGYLKIGAFENGIAEGSVDQSIGKIQAIRLLVNSDSPVWAIISEVLIKASEN
ncbi:alpha-1,3-mannosyl-glycoprotein 4-beta-N-acetylglucosaminyltransferase-like protein MGAT4D isoform X1 [Falco biarmicus]|uniref:alpha-1,3-mannosyl-glycoprotein 4-beta-N-acetylglucosaminyltransferase-like protein MGAT4D isoform X1 n=2 Tax=Falco rusticolus TaxID=120794 RepID=UPI0018866776|nr:alpha-1,3-mannosyl-glycoprotein 4-beta-N-acetylglucosaminyltransferase-like protein MGAT4D isoform X1 [Falco rusticolus]XP_055552771.1 alpha-1,3-mannosyl-glycoprotein 4-beta-N-acetylglucosaminyltransferase-like protein MGAT4D isoform X1 [Falco cherrug]XP_056218828.1 alpha-1,3-mannosyl-glycoprotein 4-beta-N-acetylglucosaminyltransferase-like protein MGAT4D isoform X1 [Falco biarmicus]